MTRDDIRAMIEEEITRQELADYRDGPTTVLQQIGMGLRHPITLTLVGFLLTSLVGTWISQSIADRAQRDEERGAALAAVQSFASSAAELRVQQGVFEAALRREVSREALSATKVDYDRAYVQWNSERYKSYLLVRSFFGFTYSNFAEQLVSRTIHQDFRAVNTCLTQAYDAIANGAPLLAETRAASVTVRIDACLGAADRPAVTLNNGTVISAFARRQEEIFQCSRQIFDPLHHYISQDFNCAHEKWHSQNGKPAAISAVYDHVWSECGVGDKPRFNDYGKSAQDFCTIKPGRWALLP